MSAAVHAGGLHSAWARLFARALASSGVRDVVVSPGSRSTPLALALAMEPALRTTVVIDERSAGFFALGQARVTGAPTALLCTSGSAAAHYHPAVLEASHARLPLLVLTADRPWDAYDAAAPQTVDQVKLFGSSVRHYAELGLPDAQALDAVSRIAAQCALATRWPDPGPVHVNARFRKPLEPVPSDEPAPWHARFEALFERGAPFVFAPQVSPDPRGLALLADALAGARRPLFAAGPALHSGPSWSLRAELAERCAALRVPLYAESASDLRHGPVGAACVRISSFEALRASPSLDRCDLLVEFGLPPVGAAYAGWVSSRPGLRRIVVAPHGYNDPYSTAAAMLYSDPEPVVRALASIASTAVDPEWAPSLAAVDARARSKLDALGDAWGEPHIARALWGLLPEHTAVLLGNGTAVRDADSFGVPSRRSLRVLHQRGTSGIDGLIAGAAGARATHEGPVLVVLGDVSAAHDAGSLALLRDAKGPLVVLSIDNGGGRIFEQLPLASPASAVSRAHFERLFLTPGAPPAGAHALAEAHGVAHRVVADKDSFASALHEGLASSRPLFIEARVDGALGVRARTGLVRSLAEGT